MTTPAAQILAPFFYVSTIDLERNIHKLVILSETEFPLVKGWLENAPQPSSLTKSLLIPIRTNQHLIEDLFYPINTQHFKELSRSINNVFLSQLFFGSLFLISLMTLPIRCITLIPRMLMNLVRRKDPFHEYLTGKVSDQILTAEKVQVSLTWYQPNDQKNKFDQHFISQPYAFNEVPSYPHKTFHGKKAENRPETVKELIKIMNDQKKS